MASWRRQEAGEDDSRRYTGPGVPARPSSGPEYAPFTHTLVPL